jgi:hypothetical protein
MRSCGTPSTRCTSSRGIVQRIAAQLPKLRRIPAIAAEQRHLHPEFAGQPHDDPNLSVITGNIDNVRIQAFDPGQLVLIIRLAGLRVRFLCHDLSAQPGEFIFKKLR